MCKGFLAAAAVGLVMLATVPTALAIEMEQATDAYDAALAKHVTSDGLVRYEAMLQDRAALDDFVSALGETNLAALPDEERLATLINAYNAFALSMVLEKYPFDHVLDALDQPFDTERWTIDGKTYSLNQIETDLIRGAFDEPRIHWAVNCAAVSCPPLRAEAYRGDQLETQFAEQESRTLGDAKYVKLDGDTLRLSMLFDWYAADFEKAAGSAKDYVSERVPAVAEAGLSEVVFLPYDWTLNDAGN